MSVEILQYLCDWVANHIQVQDLDYGPFLLEKGAI